MFDPDCACGERPIAIAAKVKSQICVRPEKPTALASIVGPEWNVNIVRIYARIGRERVGLARERIQVCEGPGMEERRWNGLADQNAGILHQPFDGVLALVSAK